MPGPIGKNLCVASLCISALVAVTSSHAELPAEPIPNIAAISPDYPDSLIFVHDANFDALIAGRVILVDVAPETHNYKGALDAAQFPSFTESAVRSELYVAETFYSRGTRGVRTDVVTIYDKEHLQPIGRAAKSSAKPLFPAAALSTLLVSAVSHPCAAMAPCSRHSSTKRVR